MTVAALDTLVTMLRARPAKAVARLADVHPRTAARWQTGETTPGADHLITMMARDAELFAEVARLAGRADAGQLALAQQHIKAALAAIGGE